MTKFLKGLLIIGSLTVIQACSHNSPNRAISFESKDKSEDILSVITRFQERIQNERGGCSDILSGFYEAMKGKTSKSYNLDVVALNAKVVMEQSFVTRLMIREKLSTWNDAGERCINESRKVLRVLRVIEEYVGLIAKAAKIPEFNTNSVYMKGTFPDLISQAGDFVPERDLKSGDFIISRGNAFASALIARMGDEDAQFSHLALVYEDEVTAKKYVIEAHLEVGVMYTPLSEYLKSQNSRAAVFRQKDEVLGHKAASMMFNRVKTAIDNKKPVCYDFEMNGDDPTCLFCSEVGQSAYFMASNGQYKIPLYPSTIQKFPKSLKEKLGITSNHAFLPGDLEVDPRFDLIAEWRSFPKIADTHKKDAILISFYQWMETQGYEFKAGVGLKVLSKVLWGLRRFPIFSSLLKNKFPKNMPASTIEINFLLAQLGEKILTKLEGREKKLKQDFPLTMIELLDLIEAIRVDDLDLYSKYLEHTKTARPGAPYPHEIGWHFNFHPPTIH